MFIFIYIYTYLSIYLPIYLYLCVFVGVYHFIPWIGLNWYIKILFAQFRHGDATTHLVSQAPPGAGRAGSGRWAFGRGAGPTVSDSITWYHLYVSDYKILELSLNWGCSWDMMVNIQMWMGLSDSREHPLVSLDVTDMVHIITHSTRENPPRR